MSLILEALRKSEAERRRGRMPDVHAELPPPAAARAASVSPWAWSLGGLVLALLALGAWLAMSGLQSRSPQDTPRSASAPSIPTAGAAPLPPVPHLQRMPASPPRRDDVRIDEVAVARPVATATATAAVPSADPAPTQTHVATSSPAVAPSAQPLPGPPPTRDGATVLQLSDLAPAERKALPPLKISMHMWNDDAARRFVIVDGNRLGEGDRIGDAIVTAITRDGVLLDWNGLTLKLPLR